jgi:ubiquinone/menaquinone biosynthesis C-methylase UbiE
VPEELESVYRKRARRYDAGVRAQALLGFRQRAIHAVARRLLDAPEGGTVADLGCGTGLNLPALSAAVGPDGLVFGVDASQDMLARARVRVQDLGLENVELKHADIRNVKLPRPLDGALFSFVLQFLPDARPVLERTLDAVRPGGRTVSCDLEPPSWFAPAVLTIAGRYGHNRTTLARRPRRVLAALGEDVQTERRFAGMVAVTRVLRAAQVPASPAPGATPPAVAAASVDSAAPAKGRARQGEGRAAGGEVGH